MTTTLSKALGSQGGVVLGPAGGARPPHRRRAAVHLRHRAGPRCGRRRVGRAAGADRRAVARAGRAGSCVGACRDMRRRRAPGFGGGVGHPRRAGGGAGCRGGVPGSRRAGRLLPPADGPGRHVAAAADGAGVTVRRRNGFGPRGTHRSARADARERSRRHGHRHRRRQDGGHCGAGLSCAAGRRRRRSVQTRADRQPARRRPRRCGAAVRGQRPVWHMALSRTARTRRGCRARRDGAADARRAGGVGRIGRRRR